VFIMGNERVGNTDLDQPVLVPLRLHVDPVPLKPMRLTAAACRTMSKRPTVADPPLGVSNVVSN
jgi:hypothetical protein